MTKMEAYQHALDFFVKRNHSNLPDAAYKFNINEVFELADQILAWSILPVQDENGNKY